MSSLPSVDCDVLIVRGVDNTDGLASLGLPVASRYENAHTVILVPDAAPARIVKGRESDWTNVRFIDADSRMDLVGGELQRVSDEYERAHPDHAHLAHAFVGLFLLYYYDQAVRRRVIDMLRDGDARGVREAADRFIASDFGDKPTPADSLHVDGISPGPGDPAADAQAA